MKNLTWLFLAGSNLRGEIPESIFELSALGTLDICRNNISGNFPKSISKLQNLWKIELYQNNLTRRTPGRASRPLPFARNRYFHEPDVWEIARADWKSEEFDSFSTVREQLLWRTPSGIWRFSPSQIIFNLQKQFLRTGSGEFWSVLSINCYRHIGESIFWGVSKILVQQLGICSFCLHWKTIFLGS